MTDVCLPMIFGRSFFSLAFSQGIAVFVTVAFQSFWAFLCGLYRPTLDASFDHHTCLCLLIHVLIPLSYFLHSRPKFPEFEKPISVACQKYGNGGMFFMSCIYVIAYCITRGNLFAVMALTGISTAALSWVKLFASIKDSITVSCWFMAAPTVAGFLFIFGGFWEAALWAFSPSLIALVSTVVTVVFDEERRRAEEKLLMKKNWCIVPNLKNQGTTTTTSTQQEVVKVQ